MLGARQVRHGPLCRRVERSRSFTCVNTILILASFASTARSLWAASGAKKRGGTVGTQALDFACGLIDHGAMEIQFTTQIFKEGRTFVAHALELDVSSCGGTKERALKNLKEAVRLFLEEAEKLGTLEQILEEAGYLKRRSRLEGPKFIGTRRVSLPLPMAHAKA